MGAAKSARGLRRTPHGWQAFIKVHGQFRSKRFPLTTPLVTMQRWLAEKRAVAELKRLRPHFHDAEDETSGPRIEHDVARYLAARSDMPSLADRRLHLEQWVAVFRGRARTTITPLEIRTHLARWRQHYSASSVNKRRTALMSLYTELDGKSARNPVRDVPKYAEAYDEQPPRAQTMVTFYRLLRYMPESKTRIRLRVILWTGWPHAQVMRLKREHLDLKRQRAYVTPRRKGKGRQGRWVPLLPGAVRALQLFQQWDCFGDFSQSAMHKSVRLALTKLNAHRATLKLPPLTIRPYDARHTFGTYLAQRLEDDRAIQELMLHASAAQTRRYTESATEGRVQAAVAKVASGVATKAPAVATVAK